MPLGMNPSENIAEMTKAKAGQRKWPRKRIIAAGLNAAREHGGKAKMPPGKHMMKSGHLMSDKDMEPMMDDDMPKKKAKLRYLGKG